MRANIREHWPRWFDSASYHIQSRGPSKAIHALLGHILAIQMQTLLRRCKRGANHGLPRRICFERHGDLYETLGNLRQLCAFGEHGGSRIPAASVTAAKQGGNENDGQDDIP